VLRRSPTRGSARTHREVLTPGGEEVLHAVAPVVLGSLVDANRPDGAAALADAMGAIDDYLAHLSLPLQQQARVTLAALASPPARAALLRTGRPWRETSTTRIETALTRLRQSPVPALRRLYDFLHSLIVLGWFDLPVAWEGIGYPGPPAESAVVRRAAL